MKKIAYLLILLVIAIPSLSSNDRAVLEVSPTKYELGNMKKDEIRSMQFICTNTGNAPLILYNVSVSCGCVTTEWEKKPILAGESPTINVYFNPKTKHGVTINSIYIQSNACNDLEIVRIYSNVTQ